MRFPRSWPVLACALSIAAGPAQDGSPFPPLSCYQAATTQHGLISSQAEQLCVGARSDAPVACYAEAAGRLALTDLASIQLCALATSDEPARCVARLQQTTSYDQATMVDYCAAARYGLASPPEAGAASCLQAARAETFLSDTDAVRLCQGSDSPAPADCFAWGQKHTLLADNDLVDLCTTVVPYAAPFGLVQPGVSPY